MICEECGKDIIGTPHEVKGVTLCTGCLTELDFVGLTSFERMKRYDTESTNTEAY